MQRTLGIDLGTTNSVMAYIKRGQPVIIANRDSKDLTPSVVGRWKDDLLVGESAKHLVFADPGSVYSVKRFMGRKYADPVVQEAIGKVRYRVTAGPDGDVRVWLGSRDYSPTEISAIILRRLKEDAEARVGEEFGRAVITVPAYFGERQVSATHQAGEMAGFHVLRIINEPTAAALAFGFEREKIEECKTVMVYDLGGGTFDISIIMLMPSAFTVMGIEGNNMLGGDDFDQCVMDWSFDQLRSQAGRDLRADRQVQGILKERGEEAKIQLSEQTVVPMILPVIGSVGDSAGLELSRTALEGMIRDRIEETISLTEKALQNAHLTANEIDYILLVGGSSAIPLVQRSLAAKLGAQKLRRDVNPMQCVAIGAALQSALLHEIECPACQEQNTVFDDFCQKCGHSLSGTRTKTCPQCFVPCAAGVAQCWKCGTALAISPEDAAPVPVLLSTANAVEKCPTCGNPYRTGLATCPTCGAILKEEGGLRCAQCGSINRPGVSTCQQCGTDMQVTNPVDITPKPIGIELEDGRMCEMVPKGTVYPTPEMITSDFFTAVAAQRRLDVALYEGDRPRAKDNELLGQVSRRLPNGLPKDTRIRIGLGVDENRTLTVRTQLPDVSPEFKLTRVQRGQADPERIKRIEQQRGKVVEFTDRWAQELTEPEQSLFESIIEELDAAITSNEGGPNGERSLDSLLTDVERNLEMVSKCRSNDAVAGNILGWEARYLAPENVVELKRLHGQIEDARRRGDWDRAEKTADELTARLPVLAGYSIMMTSFVRSMISHHRLSSSLHDRVAGALLAVDDGISTGNRTRFEQGMQTLDGLWPEVEDQIEEWDRSVPIVTKPRDRQGT